MAASSDSTYLDCTTRKISSLQELKPGDHIAVMETCMEGIITYKHHLLVVEVVNDKIVAIHKKLDVSVVEGTVDYGADEITVLDYDCPYTGKEAIARARERMDQGYSLLTSNCEHFVTEARTGQKQSIQVQKVAKVAAGATALGVGVALLAGAVYLATRKGKEKEDKKDSDSDVENDAAQ